MELRSSARDPDPSRGACVPGSGGSVRHAASDHDRSPDTWREPPAGAVALPQAHNRDRSTLGHGRNGGTRSSALDSGGKDRTGRTTAPYSRRYQRGVPAPLMDVALSPDAASPPRPVGCLRPNLTKASAMLGPVQNKPAPPVPQAASWTAPPPGALTIRRPRRRNSRINQTQEHDQGTNPALYSSQVRYSPDSRAS